MTVLISAANGKTGRSVIAALRMRSDAPEIRALSRSEAEPIAGVTRIRADFTEPKTLALALEGVDTVIHYGPPQHPSEVAMGRNMIDAAKYAGVRRFVFLSVIHPEIDDLVNHQAKLAIEGYLINAGLDWTVLRPQHYMQNVNVVRIVEEGRLALPYPVETVLGHVDMRDLAEAAVKVALEPGHSYATYDIAADEHLSVRQMAEIIARRSNKTIEAVAMDPYDVVKRIAQNWSGPISNYTVESYHRMFGYYARNGLYGNPNVLTWLLGRLPGSFEAYVARSLAGDAGPVGNAYIKRDH